MYHPKKAAMLHFTPKRGPDVARLSASFREILEINSFFFNIDN